MIAPWWADVDTRGGGLMNLRPSQFVSASQDINALPASLPAVLEALLEKYADDGVETIEDAKVLRLKPFSTIGTPLEIIKGAFGGKDAYEAALRDLEDQIYGQAASE